MAATATVALAAVISLSGLRLLLTIVGAIVVVDDVIVVATGTTDPTVPLAVAVVVIDTGRLGLV